MKFKNSIDKIKTLSCDLINDNFNNVKSKKQDIVLTCNNCIFYKEVNQICKLLYTYHFSDDYCKNHKIKQK